MTNLKILFPLFLIVAFFQWLIPVKSIWDVKKIENYGRVYDFRLELPDSSLPDFGGNYIKLYFSENDLPGKDSNFWKYGETIYVQIARDRNGFAKVQAVSKRRPPANVNFIRAQVGFEFYHNKRFMGIQYPFDKYYLDGSRVREAEQIYKQIQKDSSQIMFARIKLRKGDAQLTGVFLNGKPLNDVLKSMTKSN